MSPDVQLVLDLRIHQGLHDDIIVLIVEIPKMRLVSHLRVAGAWPRLIVVVAPVPQHVIATLLEAFDELGDGVSRLMSTLVHVGSQVWGAYMYLGPVVFSGMAKSILAH